MKKRIDEARELLAQHSQEHLLNRFDVLTPDKKEELLDGIFSLDFDLIDDLYQLALKPVVQEEAKIEPIAYLEKDGLDEEDRAYFSALGEDAIRSGKLAVVTMAGGQGTRLGFNGPKGAFIFDKENNTSIFEALCNTLKEANKEYGVTIRWYLMTSRENNQATVDFFEANDYFGYPEGEIKFFTQGELPMVGVDGKIMLDKDGMIKFAANGHGGTLISMEKAGVLKEMKADGIEWVFICGVDNVLVKPVDPLFMGISIYDKVLGAIKSVTKTDPAEKVGVICRKNGKPGVVEYTEISKEMAEMRDDAGNLVYGDANALFNLYNIKGLEKIAEMPLPYHVAFKKCDYWDEDGNFVTATEPNAYKFESFIFDSYEKFDDVIVLRVKREEEFSPIKNASGQDSPETALKMYRDFIISRNI